MSSFPNELYGVVAYFAVCGVVAYLTRRTRTFAEFSVGNRKIPTAMIFASLAATYIGPGFSVGFAGKGFVTGYLFFLLSLTYAVQTILVGCFFAPRLSRFRDCHTIGEVMAHQYGPFVHLLSGIVSVALCIGFTAIMGKIAGQLLHSITGWPLVVSIAIVTMSTAFLTFTGGVRAVIANDSLQFIWFSFAIPILLLCTFFNSHVSPSEMAEKAAELTRAGFAGLTGMQIVGIMVAFLLGETLIPPYANRALAAKTESASRRGFVLAGIYCIIWLGMCTTLGIYGHQFVPAQTAADDVFLGVGKFVFNKVMYGVLFAAVLAIIMSSQESVLNSASVALIKDILGPHAKLKDRTELLWGRTGTIVIAAIAVVVAQYSPTIIDGLLICYSIWAPSLLLPFLLGLYLNKTKPAAGWLSMLCGGITSILWQTVLKEPGGTPAILVGLAACAVGYFIGHIIGSSTLTRKGEII